jgi:hypothetical protein
MLLNQHCSGREDCWNVRNIPGNKELFFRDRTCQGRDPPAETLKCIVLLFCLPQSGEADLDWNADLSRPSFGLFRGSCPLVLDFEFIHYLFHVRHLLGEILHVGTLSLRANAAF